MKSPLRRLAGRGWNYAKRLDRWRSVLTDVQGTSPMDHGRLVLSGAASPFVSLEGLSEWRDPQLLFDVEVNVRDVGKFLLRKGTDDLWHVLPRREQPIFDLLRAELKSGDTFVDAGANIGVYSVLAAKLVGPAGRVVAVEMMPDTADQLHKHISLNRLGNVEVIQQALADTHGQVLTLATPPRGQHGQASIRQQTGSGGVRVETTTLDLALASTAHVAILKMDLEGAEEAALKGASEVLGRTKCVIYEDWGDESSSRIFREAGFLVSRIDGNNCLARRIRK